ncbi:MAG TPA: zinc dependent phospholipase C family protein [Gemmatimonadales bacterium]
MTGRAWALAGFSAIMLVALLPRAAHAWTPGTHIFLGESVLANLGRLPEWVASLLRAFPYDFLYGNIAADTSMAKKYAPVGRHCHSWHVAQEIYDLAETDSLKAFAFGYFSHLAADCVAHNFFVPHQLVVTSRTIALGHSYWESRFETHFGDSYARTAMDVIRLDHGAADGHLDRILSPTIFSVRTSRRLFRGMVGITETQSWHRAFRVMAATSRWDLSDDDVERNMALSFELVMGLLREGPSAPARRLDPSGETSLKLAKRVRIDALREGFWNDHGRLAATAVRHFGLPAEALPLWDSSPTQRPWRDRRSVGAA